jgi:23S rRNA (guanosine2251-2'-O)-methyltransferase
VRELLLAGRRRVREVLVAAERDDVDVLQDIVDLALEAGVPVREVPRRRLLAEARSEAPQGVVARAAPLHEHDLDDLVAPTVDGPMPFLLGLDGVTDPGNLGAVLRTAECAGVTGVILPRHRATHVTPAAAKAAAGAIEHLRIAVVGGLPSALLRLHDESIPVIGLDGAADASLFEAEGLFGPVCLVLGAEGRGLSRLVRQRCDELLNIPLYGELASLNVAAAGALACYEVARRRSRTG